MTVDVLFPFYGDVALMKQAVHSVLRQSYRDFKLIVIDDGYPDDSIPGWFESLDDDRVSYERNATNLGANGNYRKALTKVTNELVVVMGADDEMLPNYLQWLVDRADEHREVEIFQPGVVVIDEHGDAVNGLVDAVKSVYRPRGTGVRVLSGERLAVSLLRGDWMYFPSLGWRAETITSIGFREGYDVVQDLALALDVADEGRVAARRLPTGLHVPAPFVVGLLGAGPVGHPLRRGTPFLREYGRGDGGQGLGPCRQGGPPASVVALPCRHAAARCAAQRQPRGIRNLSRHLVK